MLRSLPNAITVVSEWTKHFKRSGVEPVIVPNEIEDKFARTGARPPFQQPQARKTRSQIIAEHLPLLRRYARAMTGNQAPGDASVGDMLEALLQDPSLLDVRYGHRVALFRLFTEVRNSVFNNDDAGSLALPPPSELQASSLTPVSRQAFLLLSLEGFLEEEAAFILSTSVTEIRKLVEAAGRAMAAEIATDVLVIEDETFIAIDLQSLMKNRDTMSLALPEPIPTQWSSEEPKAGTDSGRHPACRRQLRPRRRQRAAAHLRGTGGLHHRLSGAVPDRRTPGAGVPISKPFQPAMVSALASQRFSSSATRATARRRRRRADRISSPQQIRRRNARRFLLSTRAQRRAQLASPRLLPVAG